jgi:hypothetical protein
VVPKISPGFSRNPRKTKSKLKKAKMMMEVDNDHPLFDFVSGLTKTEREQQWRRNFTHALQQKVLTSVMGDTLEPLPTMERLVHTLRPRRAELFFLMLQETAKAGETVHVPVRRRCCP